MKTIFCSSQCTYEEILRWRGFSFEQSHTLGTVNTMRDLVTVVDDGNYGIAESDRILNAVIWKQVQGGI